MQTKSLVFFFLFLGSITFMSCEDTVNNVNEVSVIAKALEDNSVVWNIKQFKTEDGARFVHKNINLLYSHCDALQLSCHPNLDLDVNGIVLMRPKRAIVSGEAYDVLYPLLTERYESYVADFKKEKEKKEEDEKVIRIE